MHIHGQLRKCIQDHSAELHIQLHGIQWIILSGSSCLYLKREVLVRIYVIHILYYRFSQLLKALILHMDHGTDAGNTKYCLQIIYGFIIIKIRGRFHIDSSRCTGYRKLSLASLQCISDLLYQGFFKQIAVFSFYADLSVFN